jgi:S1-C subfamily serine protease
MLYSNDIMLQNEQCIFPIIHFERTAQKFFCLGTSFLINGLGIFVTAKHVIDKIDHSNEMLMLVQYLSNKAPVSRSISCLSIHPNADIAVGMLDIARDPLTAQPVDYEIAPNCRVSLELMQPSWLVTGYGYPHIENNVVNNQTKFDIEGKWSQGEVVELHPEGIGLLKNSCYQTTMHIESGASGGPVFNDGCVVGINSSSFDLMGDENPISFITPIGYILDLQIDFKNELKTIRELISEKEIIIKQG